MTNYMTKEAIMTRMQEHYAEAEKHHEVFGVFLQGSQNYIDDKFYEGSDVDTRAFIIPSKKLICLGDTISTTTHMMENDEHLDFVDIRVALKNYKKPGINNFETMFTEYFVINPKYQEFYEALLTLREALTQVDRKGFLLATMGLSHRDLKNLQSRNGSEDFDIENFGYSRKRLSNIMRFNETSKKFIAGESFSNCLKSIDQDLIYQVRRTAMYELDEALEMATNLHAETKELAENFEGSVPDETSRELLDELLVKILSTKFK